jgi:hypothetical protein
MQANTATKDMSAETASMLAEEVLDPPEDPPEDTPEEGDPEEGDPEEGEFAAEVEEYWAKKSSLISINSSQSDLLGLEGTQDNTR